MSKIIALNDAIELVQSGSSILSSGFLGVGTPVNLVHALAETDKKDFTIIAPVASYPGQLHDLGRLAANGQIKKFIGAHIGTSKDLSKAFLAGQVEVDFVPMGTLAEAIHAAGAGLGGVLTPVGIGTMQEELHEKVTINGKDFLLYEPIGADVAFIKGAKVDKAGNVSVRGTSRGMVLSMALASKTVFVEANEIVEVGEIAPDDVEVPGFLVDYIVQGYTLEESKEYYNALWASTNVIKKGL